MAGERLGANFSIDVSQLRAGLREANQLIRETNSEFKAAAAGMDDWSKSEDGLNAKLKQLNDIQDIQQTKVNALKENYEQLIKEGLDPASNEASKLRTQINNEEAALAKTEKEIEDNTKALNDLGKEADKTGDEVETSGKSFEKFGEFAKKGAEIAGAAIASVAAAAVAAGKKIWDMANQTAEAGDEIEKNSQKVGLSYESYQKWDYAMKIAGTSMSDCATGLKTMTKTIDAAKNGSDGAIEKFERLGISVKDLEGKSREDIFGMTIEALQNVTDDTEKAALASAMFGKSGQELIPLLNQSAEATQGLLEEAEQYGMVMSDESVEASADFQDSLSRLQGTMNGVKNNLIGSLLPGISSIMSGFSDLFAGVDGGSEKVKEGVTSLVYSLNDMIPQISDILLTVTNALLSAAPDIFESLIDLVLALAPELISTIHVLLMQILWRIKDALPDLIDLLFSISENLLETLSYLLPQILRTIIELCPMIIKKILEATPQLISAAIEFLMGILRALPVILNELVIQLPFIISTITNFLISNIPTIVLGGVRLLLGLVEAIPRMLPALLMALPNIILGIADGLVDGAIEMVRVGKDLLAGLFDGLLDPKQIWESCKELFNDIIGGLKDLFGIHSPSTVMENVIGKNLALGIGEGFEDAIGTVNQEIADAMQFEDAKFNVSGTYSGTRGGTGKQIVVNQYNNYSQAHSRYEIYKSKQQTAAAVRLAMAGV